VLLGVRGLWLLRELLLCVQELLTRCQCVQDCNQIVDLQGVQFPAGLQELHLVRLRAAAAVAVVSPFCFACFVLLGVRGLWLLRELLLCVRELLTRCRFVQMDNQIVDLQGVQFPVGLQVLALVSLRAAAAVAVVSPFCFSCFVLLGVRGLWLLGVLLLCVRELLTRYGRVQDRNQIVDLQGVKFPAGLQELHLVSLRDTAAVAVVSPFCFACFVLLGVRNLWLLGVLLLCVRELLTR
jgi:hypothetical protein